ncbi:TetR/AcrR family transcriptional regulator [Mycolicibacterium sp. J2]|uniref:TetR/AcrR family transcriptional regulator n=1 Tax=Mycolicibacterium sp. J2 TaxID=2993511 RepID=UPI00224B3D36|nr:TetR/AcrR family transcriptional regulator [Mycolicibacterium sp. J2]MCX2713315.1 TetR/AcrR family transcriptional regulator [Mycolicibacterium sp. J2]
MLMRMRAVKQRVRPRREDVRDRILDAALEVFAAAGFAGATIDAIGQAAGFTKGAVYSNFGSKDELFLALLDRQFEQRGAVIAGAFGSGAGDLTATTQAVSRSMLDSIHAQRAYHLVYLEYWLRAVRDPQLRDQLVERSRVAAEHAVQVVAQAGPTLTGRQLAGLAKLFLALTTGIAMEEILQPGSITVEGLERLLTALLVTTPAE